MNTAPTVAPVVSREIAPGVQVSTAMSPQERFSAHLKAAGVQPTTKEAPRMTATMHWDATNRAVVGEVAPPTVKPAAPAAPSADAQAARIAAFDAEQRAAGRQIAAPSTAQPQGTGQPNKEYLDRLTQLYREKPAAERTTEWRLRWQQEYSDAERGRQIGENRAQFELRTAPAVKQDGVPGQAPADVVATSNAIDTAAKASGKDGFAPASAIGKELLHGYTVRPDREYHVAELTAGLRLARLGGLSQQQVNDIISKG